LGRQCFIASSEHHQLRHQIPHGAKRRGGIIPTFSINNKWEHGKTCFEIPPLDDFIGMVDGLFPAPLIINPDVGEEVVLFIRDQTPFMEQLRLVRPFRLMLNAGLGRNQFAPLVFLLFWIQNPNNPAADFAAWDCYLNPKDETWIALWRKLAGQSHWHLFLVGEHGEQREFFEFENTYGLDETLDTAIRACENIPTIDFNRAKQLFMDEHSIEDLFAMQ